MAPIDDRDFWNIVRRESAPRYDGADDARAELAAPHDRPTVQGSGGGAATGKEGGVVVTAGCAGSSAVFTDTQLEQTA